jgi:penicillin amidase
MSCRAVWLLPTALLACRDPDAGKPSTSADPTRLDGPVEVVVDTEGMAHIYGADADDVYFMQGYYTASDRLFQMDLLRRRVLGRRAEVLGAELVSSDKQSLALRFS